MFSFSKTKDKIPRAFSYCLSRTDIEGAFTHQPLMSAYVSFVRYHDSRFLDADSWRGAQEAVPVIFCRYRAPRHTPTAFGRTRPVITPQGHFVIYVYCVPRDLRSSIRTGLKRSALGLIAAWIVRDRSETWYFSNHDVTASYNTAIGSISLEVEPEIAIDG